MNCHLRYLPFLLLLPGCREKPAAEVHDAFWANTRPDSVVLKKGLGKVYLRVPRAYDTLLTWKRMNDTPGMGYYHFRFQPKSLPIHAQKENGWIDADRLRDSVNQLTVTHYEYIEPGQCRAISDSAARKYHRLFLEHFYVIRRCPPGSPCPFKHDFDTLTRINGQYFSIIAHTQRDTVRGISDRILEAYLLGGSPIRFTYELRTGQNDSLSRHFQRDALRLLRTIRIRPGR